MSTETETLLKAQLKYAELIIFRLMQINSHESFYATLSRMMAEAYFAGAKTPADFVEGKFGEEP